ncbi:fimbrial biogenesis chaperone [Winslowiella sp. 2C04]|uniref:fimbrial biogenesis chaperone n=1 Tax=Winslowiella sp. 2C04 TaxID=3416179 RepID=UPI003CFA169D
MAGPSVVGTRFIFNNDTKALNVKIINDGESDYLIKTSINSDAFIISPPLFLLPTNESNLITIIPNEINKQDIDQLFDLVITAIPRSEKNVNDNTVSLAVRSHFKLIYRHGKYQDEDFKKIELTSDEKGNYWLKNRSGTIFDLSFSTDEYFNKSRRKILSYNEVLPVKDCNPKLVCKLWINVHDGDDSVIKTFKLFKNK